MPFEFYDVNTVDNIPAQDYLIDKILPEGVILLSAVPKAGKSVLALDWALSLSAGIDWMGIPSRQTSVVYVLSEARSTLPPRTRAWKARHGKLSHELTFACGATNLCDTTRVLTDLGLHTPSEGLVIFDTVQRNMEGADENDVRAMGALIKTCDFLYENYHTSSLLVHHSTKEHTVNAAGAKVVGSWYRGHSSLLGAIDMGISLERDEEQECSTLVCKDARHDERFEPITLPRAKLAGSFIIDWGGEKKRGYR